MAKHDRPVTASIHKWAPEFAADNKSLRLSPNSWPMCQKKDIATFGYDPPTCGTPMQEADPKPGFRRRKRWTDSNANAGFCDGCRRDIHHRWHGPIIVKIRKICDVLLRGTKIY